MCSLTWQSWAARTIAILSPCKPMFAVRLKASKRYAE